MNLATVPFSNAALKCCENKVMKTNVPNKIEMDRDAT